MKSIDLRTSAPMNLPPRRTLDRERVAHPRAAFLISRTAWSKGIESRAIRSSSLYSSMTRAPSSSTRKFMGAMLWGITTPL